MEEKIETLFESEKIKIERITSFGTASPDGFVYDQPEDEYAYVSQGEAELVVEGNSKKLKAGEGLLLKKHVSHYVKSTSFDCAWLCVFIKD